LQERGPHQELLNPRVQVAYYFLGQVVVQIASRAIEAVNELAGFGGRPVPKCRLDELEAGGPTIGVVGDLGEEILVEDPPIGLTEESLRLGQVEAQVISPQLDDGSR